MQVIMLLTEIGWDTTNQALAKSLPDKILLVNFPVEADEELINKILTKAVGISPEGYTGNWLQSCLNERLFVINCLNY